MTPAKKTGLPAAVKASTEPTGAAKDNLSVSIHLYRGMAPNSIEKIKRIQNAKNRNSTKQIPVAVY